MPMDTSGVNWLQLKTFFAMCVTVFGGLWGYGMHNERKFMKKDVFDEKEKNLHERHNDNLKRFDRIDSKTASIDKKVDIIDRKIDRFLPPLN